MLTDCEKRGILRKSFTKILQALGLPVDDPNLKGTPLRLAKMYMEVFSSVGVNPHDEEKLVTTFPAEKYDQMILIDNIPYSSFCAHHFVPFSGKAWIAYIPSKRVLGLSKFTRIVQFFCAKPQIQEGLTSEIGAFIQDILKPTGLLVLLRGVHECTRCRGVKNTASSGMTTSVIYGEMEQAAVRSEAFSLIQMSVE